MCSFSCVSVNMCLYALNKDNWHISAALTCCDASRIFWRRGAVGAGNPWAAYVSLQFLLICYFRLPLSTSEHVVVNLSSLLPLSPSEVLLSTLMNWVYLSIKDVLSYRYQDTNDPDTDLFFLTPVTGFISLKESLLQLGRDQVEVRYFSFLQMWLSLINSACQFCACN